MRRDFTIWTVYHKDEQVEEYGLKETDTRKLFGTHLDDMGRGINRLNPAWSELAAMYYIWRNSIASIHIGINHYRRQFKPDVLPKVGECCCYAQYDLHDTILNHYEKCHKREDLEVAIDVLDKRHGEGNQYSEYLRNSCTLLGNMCFVMRWEDYCDMCDWLFPILDAVRIRLIGNIHYFEKELLAWREKAVRDFGEERADYQMRTISFIGERLVSAWIATNMKVIEIHAVNPQP